MHRSRTRFVVAAALALLSVGASTTSALANPAPNGSATPVVAVTATPDPESAAASAEAACQEWVATDDRIQNHDTFSTKYRPLFADAASQAAYAASGDPRWQPLADGMQAWSLYVQFKLKKFDTILASTQSVMRMQALCEAAFGLKQPGAVITTQHPTGYPLITAAPDPFPSDATAIAQLACDAWEGVFDHEDEAKTDPSSVPFATPAAWAVQAADADPAWQDLAADMATWVQLDQVDAINVLSQAEFYRLPTTDWSIMATCYAAFGTTWNSFQSGDRVL